MTSSPPNNEISRYGKSKSSSGPTENLKAVHLKTYAQVAYDIQLGRSWTLWKDKELIVPTGLVTHTNKI
jgi:hypothetical protein